MPDRVIKRFRDFMGRISRADLRSRAAFLHSPLAAWLSIIILSIILTLIVTLSIQRVPTDLELGAIANRDIKADRDYEIVDEEATETFREKARTSVLPFYDFDPGLANTLEGRVKSAFEEARNRFEREPKDLRALFEGKIGIELSADEWVMLVAERFSPTVEGAIILIIKREMSSPLVEEKIDAEKKLEIIIGSTSSQEGTRTIVEEKKVTDLASIAVAKEVQKRILKEELVLQGIANRSSKPNILKIASKLIQPNCKFDRQETDARESEAVSNVKPVIIKVTAGEMIVRNGARFEPQHLKVLRGIQRERGRGTYPYQFVGTLIIIFLILVIPFYLGERFIRRLHPSRSDYVLMAAVALVSLLILRFSLSVSPAVQQAFFFSIPDRALTYAIPVAAGVMLIRMLLSAEAALIFAIPMAICTGLFAETGIRYTVFALLSTLAAVSAASRIDKRTMIIRAGATIGLVNALVMLGLKLISIGSITEAQTIGGVLWFSSLAFVGGISSSLFVMIALPIVESASGYVTDIKLLELANLNHPLLRELIVRAPGTYHHSHLVGILAEAAAEAIGANPLLVRVGAYYHDIGKMKKPSYFIENSKEGTSRHDKLKPHMSALIVSAHVKEGIELAIAAGLPQVIVDMIPQHHGTRMIGYFYEKAKEMADPDLEKIDEKEFRYPGPKPKTREAAIMMLSDVTEAAVRSLKEKTSVRIQQTVQRCINDVFAESQLDECELTLKDLNDIGKAFVHILLGIYHQRIEYPKESSASARAEISVVEGVAPREVRHFESTSQTSPSNKGGPAFSETPSSPRHSRKI